MGCSHPGCTLFCSAAVRRLFRAHLTARSLAEVTSAEAAPPFAFFAKGGNGRSALSRVIVRCSSRPPTLAKNARVGQPQCARARRDSHSRLFEHVTTAALGCSNSKGDMDDHRAGRSDRRRHHGQRHCPCVCAQRLQRSVVRRGAKLSGSWLGYDREELGARSCQGEDLVYRQGGLLSAALLQHSIDPSSPIAN